MFRKANSLKPSDDCYSLELSRTWEVDRRRASKEIPRLNGIRRCFRCDPESPRAIIWFPLESPTIKKNVWPNSKPFCTFSPTVCDCLCLQQLVMCWQIGDAAAVGCGGFRIFWYMALCRVSGSRVPIESSAFFKVPATQEEWMLDDVTAHVLMSH
jgi:hypothetical protein